MDQGKPSNMGFCAPCKQTRILQNSHLMPKWAYRRLQQTPHGRGDPVRVTNGSAVQTSAQVTKYLLCGDCEARFGERENYVAALTETDATGKLQIVTNVTRLNTPRGVLVELGSVIDTEKLAYFAASVIWRSCALGFDCRLGRYEADFRNYLLGNANFPSAAAVAMTILESSLLAAAPENWVTLPSSMHAYPAWIHGFIVRGLAFRCYIGRLIDPQMQNVCLVRGRPKKYAAMLPADKLGDFRAAFEVLAAATPRGKLAGKPWHRCRHIVPFVVSAVVNVTRGIADWNVFFAISGHPHTGC
jgi:hypothetical protein